MIYSILHFTINKNLRSSVVMRFILISFLNNWRCSVSNYLPLYYRFAKELIFLQIMFHLLLLACLATATGHDFNTVYSWKQVEFKFPNRTIRNEYIASGDYIPNNNMPLGLAIWHEKMFVTIPRWKSGVLATLNSFSMSDVARK